MTRTNLIRVIRAYVYNNEQTYPVVRLDNDRRSPKIEVLQAGTITAFKDFTTIRLETTQQTHIHPTDTVLSMAQDQPNSATFEFLIVTVLNPR